MPAGLTVIGDHGLYQIDDYNSVNPTLAQVIPMSSWGPGTPPADSFGDWFSFSYTGSADSTPIMVLHLPLNSPNTVCGPGHASRSGNTWTWNVAFYYEQHATDFGNIAGCKALIFDKPRPTVSGQGYGLEVYDAFGKLSFSSMQPQLKIVAPIGASVPAGTYGVMGGTSGEERGLDVQLMTNNEWFYHEWGFGTGMFTDAYGAGSDRVTCYDNSGQGTGGGSTGGGAWAIQNEAFIVDIAGLI